LVETEGLLSGGRWRRHHPGELRFFATFRVQSPTKTTPPELRCDVSRKAFEIR
jgi:hypothetical protein